MPLNLGFWKIAKEKAQTENRPLFVLAPMADVTDCAFRKMINTYGKPDVTWTEFVSADGLVRATPEGKAKLMRDLVFDPALERPIVAQLFSSHPEYMKQAAKLVADLGFDGIDINMGCPDKSIEKQGCGSAMIKNPKRAQEIILAAKEGGVRSDGTALPVSVKTRIGYSKNELETWLPALLEAEPAVIIIHARTRKEMSKVPARWEHVARAVEIRDEFFKNKYGANGAVDAEACADRVKYTEANSGADILVAEKTLIFGNGDVTSIADGYEKAKATGADGVMLGREIFGNPWLFKDLKNSGKGSDTVVNNANSSANTYEPSVEEKLRVMVEHTKEFERALGDIKSFAIMKKHYKAYVNGFDGAHALRAELMEKADNAKAVEEIAEKFLAGI